VYPPEIKSLTKKAQDLFELSLQSHTLSSYDLYGSKFCAALDLQHPRDLFDVHLLLKTKALNLK
jgi:Nucleotidyl transferase AbiEii toxin, Type IV TA system